MATVVLAQKTSVTITCGTQPTGVVIMAMKVLHNTHVLISGIATYQSNPAGHGVQHFSSVMLTATQFNFIFL